MVGVNHSLKLQLLLNLLLSLLIVSIGSIGCTLFQEVDDKGHTSLETLLNELLLGLLALLLNIFLRLILHIGVTLGSVFPYHILWALP
jgi:hypothetical protein